jgi:hypothetical protein
MTPPTRKPAASCRPRNVSIDANPRALFDDSFSRPAA